MLFELRGETSYKAKLKSNYLQSKVSPKIAVCNVLGADRTVATTNEEKADALCGYFEKIHSKDDGRQCQVSLGSDIRVMEKFTITAEEVQVQLKSLKIAKAAELDDLHTAISLHIR